MELLFKKKNLNNNNNKDKVKLWAGDIPGPKLWEFSSGDGTSRQQESLPNSVMEWNTNDQRETAKSLEFPEPHSAGNELKNNEKQRNASIRGNQVPDRSSLK